MAIFEMALLHVVFSCYYCLLIDSHLVSLVTIPKDANNKNQ